MKANEKTNLDELTFCIPIRIDSEDRMRNLYAVLNYFSKRIYAHYIVLEADVEQRCLNLPSIETLSYSFVEDHNPIYHRTHYINQMLEMAHTHYAAIWDVDAILPIEQLCSAYSALKQSFVTMVYPYSGPFWAINEAVSALFRESLDIRIFDLPYLSKRLLSGYLAVGGAFLVNVAAYKQAGGENEFFVGWGPEDAERYARMLILGRSAVRIEGSLYHLYHARGLNSYYGSKDIELNTKKEFCKVCSMTMPELEMYILSWNWHHIVNDFEKIKL